MTLTARLAIPILVLFGAGPAARPGEGVTLVPIKYDAFLAKLAANKDAKLTVVDAWATWCGPCKDNFPHLVEMYKKYGSKGLAVVSVSLDDPARPKQIAEAKAFLTKMDATFANYYLDEPMEDSFDNLKISAIPAVFLFGPDGKEVQRFSLEDPNKPFTYDDVEKAIADRLAAAK